MTRRLGLLLLSAAIAAACSSSASPANPGSATEDAGVGGDPDGGERADADAARGNDASMPTDAGLPTSSGGSGGFTCTATTTVNNRPVCTTKVGSVEMKILLPSATAVAAGPLRLGLYLHGDGAAAHKSGSMFKPMIAWADAKSGFAVSFLAPNGCAWWQTPAHDCTLTTEDDPDLNADNAVALAEALEAVLKAYDVRLDGFRYYGASGGSIFLTDEWLPLQGGKYPGAFALMCGGEVTTRAYAWDKQDMAARAQNPLWLTYGDADFLLADERAAVASFESAGFAVTEKVIPNAGHCAFDAHGEAVGIWSTLP